MGRAPAFWTDANIQLLREQFVLVSIATSDQDRQDAVGRFCREAGLDLTKWEVRRFCVTAGGKVLESGAEAFDVPGALEKWKALPEAERAPGAVQVGGAIPPVGPLPPVGGLILRVYGRALMRDGQGEVRAMIGKDLWYDETGQVTADTRRNIEGGTVPQAQPDHLWLTETEWKSLMPPDPKKDDRFPMPAALADRLLRFHLNPLRIYGRYVKDVLDRKELRAGDVTLTVEAATPQAVRLRLDGFAKMGQEPPARVASGEIAGLDAWGYEPRLLGYLEYDPKKQVFTRFDIVALGEHFGRLGMLSAAASRRGLQPLGFAFELVQGDRPLDLIPPGRSRTSESYFEMGN